MTSRRFCSGWPAPGSASAQGQLGQLTLLTTSDGGPKVVPSPDCQVLTRTQNGALGGFHGSAPRHVASSTLREQAGLYERDGPRMTCLVAPARGRVPRNSPPAPSNVSLGFCLLCRRFSPPLRTFPLRTSLSFLLSDLIFINSFYIL